MLIQGHHSLSRSGTHLPLWNQIQHVIPGIGIQTSLEELLNEPTQDGCASLNVLANGCRHTIIHANVCSASVWYFGGVTIVLTYSLNGLKYRSGNIGLRKWPSRESVCHVNKRTCLDSQDSQNSQPVVIAASLYFQLQKEQTDHLSAG